VASQHRRKYWSDEMIDLRRVITVEFDNYFIQNFSSVTIQTQGLVIYGIEMCEMDLVHDVYNPTQLHGHETAYAVIVHNIVSVHHTRSCLS